MTNVDEASIAKLKTHGQNFEILVDSDAAIALKGGQAIDIADVLAVQTIYSDAKKGLEAPEASMNQVFKTSDPLEVAKIIIQKGDVPLTTEYKEKLRETKKRQIIDMIRRNAVDPKTHIPHPATRIEAALEEAKFRVDEFTPLPKQVEEAIKSLRPILAIKFEVKEIAVKIPGDFAAKSYSVLAKFGKKLREEWQKDGSYVAVLEMPGGLEEDFHTQMNALCHGDCETKVLKTK
ncbi:MAG: ribosome assembly factor SBDS [Candidatus Woesearchaeota archaeon]|jgi:ribosome maturation protein SDO1|nr:ribosome assembly factor SBDS [Candidatus Woesearchaeota archaeon]MDP7180461.1 ribosome assembly factor SBDS [Candidatus Woesearchaeota archaeon]MDP7457355.1 ribosome assembly factor SBDS [Candidatus Woesearchaeota archaeon]